MKTQKKIISIIAALLATSFSVLTVSANATEDLPSSSDVEYVKVGNYIANWGTRGETSTFLSTYAEAFYTGEYAYETLSQNSGGNSQATAPQSELYSALRAMMTAKHTHITNYQETRYQYCYTDCEKGDYSTISSFYSGKQLSGTWDKGATWNREHTWPNSKGLGGSDENDIMMLRPTAISENSSRGNKAYGESAGYYEPQDSVKGDCARIVLYTYTRWGNVQYMWGESGVMESLDILLSWMEADPVDTWEMGRNDAVQAITGTRNAFVDYPEYAWLLFGKELPEDMPTPSGITIKQPDEEEDTETDIDTATDIETDTDIDTETDIETDTESDTEEEKVCKHSYGDPFIITKEDGVEIELYVCNQCGYARYQEIEDASGCNSSVGGVGITSLLTGFCAYLCAKRRRK